jgi:hypothetical protein
MDCSINEKSEDYSEDSERCLLECVDFAEEVNCIDSDKDREFYEKVVLHQRLHNYSIFRVEEGVTYAVLKYEWEKYFYSGEIKGALYESRGEWTEYIHLTLKNVKPMKTTKTNSFIFYVLNQIFYPEETFKYNTEIEYAVGYSVIQALQGSGVNIRSNEEILGYYPDYTLYYDTEGAAPVIVIEVDEDNHDRYDTNKEVLRQRALEGVNYHFMRVSVDRKLKGNYKGSKFNSIMEEFISNVKAEIAHNRLLYTERIDNQEILTRLEEKGFGDLAKVFYGKDTPCPDYPVAHQDLAEYLGFSKGSDHSYSGFLTYIRGSTRSKPVIDEGIHWKRYKPAGCYNENISTYYLNREACMLICSHSTKPKARDFAFKMIRIVEYVFNMVNEMRVRLIENGACVGSKRKDVSETIKAKATNRKNAKELVKANKRIEELERIVNERQSEANESVLRIRELEKANSVMEENSRERSLELAELRKKVREAPCGDDEESMARNLLASIVKSKKEKEDMKDTIQRLQEDLIALEEKKDTFFAEYKSKVTKVFNRKKDRIEELKEEVECLKKGGATTSVYEEKEKEKEDMKDTIQRLQEDLIALEEKKDTFFTEYKSKVTKVFNRKKDRIEELEKEIECLKKGSDDMGVIYEEEDLKTMKKSELLKICEENQWTVTKKMKKAEIIEFILQPE